MVVRERFLISFNLLKERSADATVAGMVNKIRKLTQTFGKDSQV